MLTGDILIRTKVATAATTARDVFEECLGARLQSLPFCDEQSRVCGRVTLKHIITTAIVPEYVAKLAHVLPLEMESFRDMEDRLKLILDQPIEPFVQEPHASITSATALMKALAVMEQHDTSYVFVVDDGEYKGTLTIPGIASWLTRFDA